MADYDVKVLEISKGGNTYTYDAGGTHYAVCDTAAGTQTKAVTISEIASLTAGLSVCIKFSNAQTYNGQPKLQINSLTAANIVRMGTTAAAQYEWNAGEVLDFVYDGTNFIIQEGAVPTTTYYGSRIKLSSATNSTSEDLAATPKAVKAAYDLANGKASTSVASQSANGLMSSTDKKKLDGIATGATANVGTITGINMNGASKGTSGVVNLGTVLTSHQDISSKANRDEIGIVVTGKTASQNVTSGQYVIVRNSTISGISDGLYIASANVSSGTAFTSANLTAVSNGGLNSLNEQIAFLKSHSSANATPMTTYISDGTISCERTGNMLTFSGTFCFKSANIAANTTIFALNAYRPGNDYLVQAMELNNITKHVNLRLCSDATLRKAPSGNIENDADWYYLCVTVPFHT